MTEITLLGIRLTALPVAESVERGLRGSLVLAPSGPGLCDLASDADYRDALLGADMNLTDSSFALILRMCRGHQRVVRTSGLKYLRHLLDRPETHAPGSTYWVMPSDQALDAGLAWLNKDGERVREDCCYVAPIYPRTGAVEDEALLMHLQERRPRHIFVCVGGGVQEKLGWYLKRNLPPATSIHCIGAAIGFLSGQQAPIAPWVDRLGLGWLHRCLDAPKVFVPRYLRATKLAYLILRYDEQAPPIARSPELSRRSSS